MKFKNRIPLLTSPVLLILATIQIVFAGEKEPNADLGEKAAAEIIPPSAHFNLMGVKLGHKVLVGRLGLRRQFLGTSANPPYQDLVQFYCFNGEKLDFSTFASAELEDLFSKRLARGLSLPVVVTVQFKSVRVGHDGINMSERFVAQIEKCELTTAQSICSAAEAGGFDGADSERFKAALVPSLVKDGVVVSIGEIWMQSKNSHFGSVFVIDQIRVFNTSSKDVTIEVTEVEVEQGGVTQRSEWSELSRGPLRWKVQAGGWADGLYEDGKMPRTTWSFDLITPIDPKKTLKVSFGLKLNGGETMTVTRTINYS